MTGDLSANDVKRLLEDSSAESRALAAEKVAGTMVQGELGTQERAIAEDIFRILMKDAEQRVRLALSKRLKDSKDLSPDIARALASDQEDAVALPMIRYSEALSDGDLIAIVQAQPASRQVAVAGRDSVSPAVSAAIAEHGDRDAVARLVGNPGAEIGDTALGTVVDRFGDDEQVQTPLVHRPQLPVTIAEKLVSRVSDALKRYLVTHHELPEATATDLILHAREQATVGLLVGAGQDEEDEEALVEQLHAHGRLTPSIVLRALCIGDMRFFEAALAKLANVPLVNARILIHDEGALGLKSLYMKAGLPPGLFRAFRAAVLLIVSGEGIRSDADPETLMRRNLERVLTMAEDPSGQIGEDSAEYLLTKFNELSGHKAA